MGGKTGSLASPGRRLRVAEVIEQVSAHRLAGGTTGQVAARLLVIMDVLGTPVPATCPVRDAVKCIKSLTRLMKADFWLRNPDYLADELLSELEASRQSADAIFSNVIRMLGGGRSPPFIVTRWPSSCMALMSDPTMHWQS